MTQLKLFGIPGALRQNSTNRKLLAAARHAFGPADYAEADLRLPLYDGDDEARTGIPASVQNLADQIAAADAVIIATPEYNRAPPGVLKNALDWISRTPGRPFRDKPLAIMSVADGPGGGDRSQYALRLMLVSFRPALVNGPELAIPSASTAFDAEGQLTAERHRATLAELMESLRAVASRR